MNDIRTLHTRALAVATEAVDAVRPEQLGLPTPCTGWTLRRLLEHMAGQNHGFAAAARGLGDDPARWADRPVGDDPAAVWAHSAEEVGKAFAEAADDAPFRIPEIRAGVDFPALRAVSFHYLDTLVHGWDVAAALGRRIHVGEDLAEALLAVASAVPADPEARTSGQQFRDVVAHPADAPAFDRALALLGRDPSWAPPAG